jgi:hypothetical protein
MRPNEKKFLLPEATKAVQFLRDVAEYAKGRGN